MKTRMKKVSKPFWAVMTGAALMSVSILCAEPAVEKVAYMGVLVTRADETLRQQLRLNRGVGLTVEEVSPGSPADKAGLKKHDLLEQLDDQWLFNGEQFGELVRTHQAGDKVTLKIRHDGQSQRVEVTLDQKELAREGEKNVFEFGSKQAYKFFFNNRKGGGGTMTFPRGWAEGEPSWKPGAFLGVETQGLEPSLVAQLGLKENSGVLVGHVVEGSPANKAGLLENDIILKVDEQSISGPEALVKSIRSHAKGDKVRLEILRGGKSQTIEATLGQEEMPGRERLHNMMKRYGQAPEIEFVHPQNSRDEDMLIMKDILTEDERVGSRKKPPVTQTKTAGAAMMRIKTEDGVITVKQNGDGRVAVVKDLNDRTLFEGPIDTEEQRAKLPEAVRARLEEVDQQVKPGADGPRKDVQEMRIWNTNPEPGFI